MNEQKSKIYLPDPNGYVRISHKLGNEIKDEKSGMVQGNNGKNVQVVIDSFLRT